jgi:glycine cleavage system T protein
VFILKRTPLYSKHKELNGKIVDFGGWELPLYYEKGIIEEHKKVRNSAGLFDVSHMGEIFIEGKDSKDLVQFLITNDIDNMKKGDVTYSPMCYETGGVVDDILVYKFDDMKYLLVVNASNIEKDYKWILKNSSGFDVECKNVSSEYFQLALQGPNSERILQRLTETNLKEIKFYNFKDDILIKNIRCIVSRTGYTGEDGFEIYSDSKNAVFIWKEILKAGKDFEILPIGLGARDILRFEVGLPLYGHELSEKINPINAGLKKFIKFKKDNFIGKENLEKYIENKPDRKIIGFEMIDKGIARNGYELFVKDINIGYVTTGSFSPSTGKNLGLALVNSDYAEIGNEIEIQIRKKRVKAIIVKKPFYNKKYKK